MDTINNMTNVASKAIWGDQTQDPNNSNTTPRTTETGASTLPSSTDTTFPGSTGAYTTTGSTITGNETGGREPISGQMGDVKSGEPYDRGNLESSPYTAKTSDPRVHTGLGSSSTSNSTAAGPHSSNLANTADPRVDSDLDNSRTTEYTVGESTTTGSTTAGPHSSNLVNKADPRVDSDLDGSRTAGSTTGDNSNTLSSTTLSSTTDSTTGHKPSVPLSPKTLPITGTTPVTSSNLRQEDTSTPGVTFSEQQAPSKTQRTTTTDNSDRPGPSPTFPSGAGIVSGHTDSPMHGAHSHRGTGQFRTTQDTLNARASRDLDEKSHNSLDNHRMDARSKSIADSMHDGKGTPGAMPDVIKKDLDATKPGEISAKYAGTGGSSTTGINDRSASKTIDSSHHSTTDSSATHSGEKEKMSLGDKIKAKLHHH